ncbi:GNAT family N-acetyltransferase [Ekhidna sp.]|uniref:GNAT family N-acetyltransferase n=1 Tax=Ekhidna sp. TaxID=2608089 RepID=UPI0032978C86
MELHTDRLVIRNAEIIDAPFFLKLMNTETWIEHIGDRSIHDHKDAINYIESSLITSHQQNGFALDVMTLNKAPIGICGLIKRDYLEYPDLGFALLPEYTGNGFIQEAGTAVLHSAFEKLELFKVFAITSLENHRSQATLMNLGFEEFNSIKTPENQEVLLFEKQKK